MTAAGEEAPPGPRDGRGGDPAQAKIGAAANSVLAALFLTAAKVGVGVASGSLGVISEAVHSGLDLLAALGTLVSVRQSAKPPDASYHYGRHKFESVSALAASLLLLATAGSILYEGFHRLIHRHGEVRATWDLFVVLGVSIAVDVSRSAMLFRVARETKSQALHADALHFYSDIFSCAVVIVGLVSTRLGFPQGDSVAAILVSVYLLHLSIAMLLDTARILLDRAPREVAEEVERIARATPGVAAIGRIRVRGSADRPWVDLNLGAAADRTLEAAHAVALRIERRILERYPEADVVVHLDPAGGRAPLPALVRTIALGDERVRDVHGLMLHRDGERFHVHLHLEFSRGLTLAEAHAAASAIEDRIRRADPSTATVTTHLEVEEGPAAPFAGDRRELEEAARRAIADALALTGGVTDPHRLALRVAGGRVHLTFHARAEGTMPLPDAHDLSTRIEALLRARLPELDAVVIHLEPRRPAAPPSDEGAPS